MERRALVDYFNLNRTMAFLWPRLTRYTIKKFKTNLHFSTVRLNLFYKIGSRGEKKWFSFMIDEVLLCWITK